jgi:uncharacterized membrane protein YGL010W
MKTKEEWLVEYAASHQNRANQIIHKVCVPLILFTIVGAASLLRLPGFEQPWGNSATLLSLATLVFYFRLGWLPFFLMLLSFAIIILLALWANSALAHPLLTYAGLFVLAWIGQFIGHRIEGKQPSFLQDLQFLLIGPLWIFLGRLSRSQIR